MQIFIVGMHRSGTSMLARLLNMMGAYFGPEGISTGVGRENPKGFWERKDVRALNDQILHATESEWYKVSNFSLDKIQHNSVEDIHQKLQRLVLELDAHRPWLLKEPRFCLTLPLWQKYLEYPVYIHTYRSPIQIAQSLKTRNGFPLHFSIALWEKYTLESLKATQGFPRLLVLHADLIQKPLSVVKKIYAQLTELGCQGLRVPDEKEILAFISKKLHRERGDSELEASFINAQQERLIHAFESGRILEEALEFTAINLSPGAQEILETGEKLKEKEEKLKEQEGKIKEQESKLNSLLEDLDNALQVQKKSVQDNQELKAALSIKKHKEITLNQEKNQAEKKIRTLEKNINTLEGKIADSRQLQIWLSQLSKNTESLFQSWRWKVGDRLVRLVEIALLRPRPSLAADHMQLLIQQFYAWHQRGIKDDRTLISTSTHQKHFAASEHNIVQHKHSPEIRTTIIICIHNAPDDVQSCLKSIEKYTNLKYHKLILVDDGSAATTQHLVVDYANKLGAMMIRNETALGYTKAANKGLQKAQTAYCLLLNSDTIVTPGWLEYLIHCAYSYPQTACVGPLSNAASWQSIPELFAPNGKWQVNEIPEGLDLNEYSRRISLNSARLYPRVSFLNGFCYLINRQALNQVGYLDEETFPRGYGEEDDFSIRVQDAGWDLRVADDCYIYHAKSKSFTPQIRDEITTTAKSALQAKHGKPKVSSLLQEMASNESLLIARNLAKIAASSPVRSPDNSIIDTSGSIVQPVLRIGWLQPHLKVVGGIRRAIEMTNRLIALGFETSLITPDGEKTNWLPISAQVIKIDEAKQQQFDILIVSDPDVYSSFIEIPANLRINYHLAPYHLYRNNDKNLDRYYQASNGAGRIHHIANSTWTAENAKIAYGIHNEGVFPGGINPYLFFPCNEEKIYDVVFYGSSRPHKGTATILKVTSNLKSLSLASLEASQEELAHHICKAHVFVSACWHEGFNFCPLEAMACGIPVAMTDDGGSREYAVNRENALVVPVNDSQALGEAIHELLKNKQLRLRLIENGLLTASKYNWDKVTADFAALILNLHKQRTAAGTIRSLL